jgi:hypothetical protein
MAKNDVIIVKSPYDSVPTVTWLVDDYTNSGSTQILAGEPVKLSGAEDGNYAIKLATGDPEIGTDIFLGIAASDDTATTTADGEVEVYMPLPGIVYRCAATTPANLAVGILGDCVTFDLTSTTYTVDENEASDEDVQGLRIVGYDSDAGTVDFEIKINATRYGCLIA